MNKNLKILITGASKGIGKFLFERFLSENYDVFGTYNYNPPQNAVIERFTKVNVCNITDIQNWIKKTVSEDDDIVLINCAGTNYNAIARKADIALWTNLIDINLNGTFRTINAVLPLMYAKGFGRIINFSSVVAQKAVAGTSAYAASKAALWGMSRVIAIENANKNITVNTLNLGYFSTGMTISDVPENVLKTIKEQIPTHELGDPENVFQAVLFLINSEYTTGTSIDINGGLF